MTSSQRVPREPRVVAVVHSSVTRGLALAIAEYQKEGRAIAVWRAGKVIFVPAEEICLSESEPEGPEG